MAIGDTWTTINTFSFTDMETVITAAYENAVVNDLQYLYNTSADEKVNVWTSHTNTSVTLTPNTNDIALNWTITFTPSGSKVFMFIEYASVYGWATGNTIYQQLGYKVNSGSIVYIGQNTIAENKANLLIVPSISVNAGVSNTITFYNKTGAASGTYVFFYGRVAVMEQAN